MYDNAVRMSFVIYLLELGNNWPLNALIDGLAA